MKIKVADIVGFSGQGIFSYCIKRITRSKWSHVGIVYAVQGDKIITAEALSNGFVLKEHKRKSLEKKQRKGSLKVRRIPGKIGQHKQVIEKYLKKKYGFFQIGLIAISLTFKKKIKGDKDKTFICSEAVAVIIKELTAGKIDIAKEYGTTQDFVYPDHIMQSKLLKDVK